MNLPAVPSLRSFILSILAFGSLGFLAAPALYAQGAPEQASAQALELFNENRIQDAANAYEQILKDYPTSTVVAEAQFRLGYLSFLLGNYDKSIELLKKILAPPAPPEIQELSYGLLPQSMAAKAGKLPPADSRRKAAFEDAIKQYDVFLQKYPKSDQFENVQYGRAVSSFQIGKYDDAAVSLRSNLTKFPSSESILDSQYLLALTLATEANLAVQKAPGAVTSQTMLPYDEAERLLRGIVEKKSDVALANDALFQIGEILFNKARFSDKAAQADLYSKAMDAYRAVGPKADMSKAQADRLAGIVKRIKDAAAAHDIALFKHLQRLQEREQGKTAQIQAKPDLTVTARIKVGEVYFYQMEYDEARVILRQMGQFASDDDQKKEVLYYITLTYASQNIAVKAVESYTAFRTEFKNDPMGENLPVVIGALFLSADPKVNDPAKALEYLKNAVTDYPNGRFKNEALAQQASALVQLRRFDEAQAAYKRILAGNPKKEMSASAEFGMASVYQNTGKIDDAIAGYRSVSSKYPGTPDAERADMVVAQLTLQAKNDPKSAISELTAFIAKYPKSQLIPIATFVLAQAQLATGNKEAALAAFKDVGDKYPKAEAGPLSYFQRAAIYASDQKTPEMMKTLQDFLTAYPDSDKVYYAYDTIGQTDISKGNMKEAIAAYSEMAERHPQNPQAPDALAKVADLWDKYAESQGRYMALAEPARKEWKSRIDSSVQAVEKLIDTYPDSAQVSLALQTLLADQRLLVTAKVETEADVDRYFDGLASKEESKPAAKSKIAFSHASYTYDHDKAKVLAQMKEAYDAKLVYAPAELDLYGSALIDQNDVEEARKVYEKLASDYPNPPGIDPAKAPQQIAEAQATALYGIGKCYQKSGNFAEAGKRFDQLQKLYPWSPKIIEANFGIAQSAYQSKDYAKATALLTPIARATTATLDLRANAMLLGGRIQEDQGNIEPAIDYYIKIATFFESVPDAAAEGLWRGGQLLEKQSASLADAAKKQAQFAKAVQAYKDLVQKYPASSFAPKAKERLQALEPAK